MNGAPQSSCIKKGCGWNPLSYKIGIMENQMETTIVYWVYIGFIYWGTTLTGNQMEKNMENEMETGMIVWQGNSLDPVAISVAC